MESELGMQRSSSAFSRDPFLSVHCQGGSMAASAVTSSIIPCEVWHPVAPMTGLLTLSSETLSPSHSSLVKFKAQILYLGWAMVVNTFHHSQDLVLLFGLFPALCCRDSSLLWCLIIKARNLTRKAAAVPFPPLTQTHNCWFAASPVGPSAKKDAGFCRAPGATPCRSLAAPWEGGGCLSCGL